MLVIISTLLLACILVLAIIGSYHEVVGEAVEIETTEE